MKKIKKSSSSSGIDNGRTTTTSTTTTTTTTTTTSTPTCKKKKENGHDDAISNKKTSADSNNIKENTDKVIVLNEFGSLEKKKLSDYHVNKKDQQEEGANNKASSASLVQYEIETIMSKRTTRKGIVQYYVKWKGYNHQNNTWEPEQQLVEDGIQDLIDAFNMTESRKIVHHAGREQAFQKLIQSDGLVILILIGKITAIMFLNMKLD